MLSLDPASVPHGGNWARPGWWDTISTHGTWARKLDKLRVVVGDLQSYPHPIDIDMIRM